MKKIKLYKLNNSVNKLNLYIYKLKYISNNEELYNYIEYINKKYNYNKLLYVLKNIINSIKTKKNKIFKINHYIKKYNIKKIIKIKKKNILLNNILLYFKKDFFYIYTDLKYKKNIFYFKIDIEIHINNDISFLNSINYLINKFNSDIIIIDYKIRGFNISNKKIFNNFKFNSIQNFINKDIKKKYDLFDINLYKENIFNTKIIIKEINLKKYLLNKYNIKNKNKIYKSIFKGIQKIYVNKYIL